MQRRTSFKKRASGSVARFMTKQFGSNMLKCMTVTSGSSRLSCDGL